MNPKSILKIIPVGFLVIGIILTIVGIPLSISRIDVSDKVETTAVITELRSYYRNKDRHWETIVRYEAYGQEYKRELGFYTSSYHEGQEIAIYFDEQDPKSIMAVSSRYTILILPAIGLI